MTEIKNPKRFDLEERTFQFANQCRILVKQLPKTIGNFEDGKQLVRSSGSVHSNYIEANEALSKKDFYHRTKICRKEAKESRSWLKLLDISETPDLESMRRKLILESEELMKIFGSIITKEK
ncbi:four helix bundle protein [Candidatus Roizmanbacteria bacterium RIFCSPLOWO2_01_FULL_37_13]|uniref:Four helix bundle protein n=1 Tax=Candidatus Roizmanbacteria bacterium RIFCSPHIGHO2_02_FULL_38_11 TaxID=1802039 RepID=A0A1F7H307_9BACT|nr:MAG: four helix bundle protein [Candidatus Roizmanbacteria bacterium RIFCSPHIGHO2_02_FULL_38_11]OGK33169.1 MAG: four helix bundle protein [Candidatus Roizmanbacteria bacterium RIFCSPHIGHO2_12_FULL_37_9b]OGK40950.1 MAG: four helix bundle protein [Candidatus Roizmanbacteria bacterium RIFCSPLOWO2_01_FULL_37_13]